MRLPQRPRLRRGAAAVEFAVILPVLMIFLLGTWELGRLVQVYAILSHAARMVDPIDIAGQPLTSHAADFVDVGRRYPEAFRINFNRCIFCGLCAEACPTLALQMTTDFEMAETDGRELIYEKEDLLVDHGGKYPDYSFWDEAGVAVTHAMGHGHQDRPPSDPRSNLP